MIKIKKTNLLLLILLSFQMSFSQPWMNKVTSEKPTFKEIQTAFYDYWKDRPIEKGQGYKPFKRWEWYWESRLLPNGDFPSPSITWDEFQKYYSQSNPSEQRSTQSNANWTSSGPSSSPGGNNGLGRINCMAFHPTDPNTFWVGTPAGGLWKTTNGGTNWTTNTDNLPVLGVSDIAVHPTNPNILYIATGDGDFGSLNGLTGGADGDTKSIGVLKSTDGGSTWTTTDLNWSVTTPTLIRRLLINPSNPQVLIAASSDGIRRTTDGGATWSNTQSGYFMDLEYKPGDPTIVYASTFGVPAKIYRSTDSGGTWNLISTLTDVLRINLAITPNAPNLVDALCAYNNSSGSGLSGLWYSSNSGASFSQYFTSNDTNNLLHGSYNASGAGGQGHYDLAYAINPNNYNDIWLGGVNTWNSTNGGSNWYIKNFWANTSIQNPNNVFVVHADKHFITFHPLLPGTMFECNDGGLYKTTNAGTTWTDLTNGMQISQMYRIGVSQSQSNPKILCGLQDNGTKLNNLLNWEDVLGGDGMECIYDGSTDTGYASSQYGNFYRSGSPGTNISSTIPFLPTELTPPTPPSTVPTPKGAWVTPLIMHPINSSTLYVGYKRVYKTTNKGDTWTAISGVLDSSPSPENLRFMAIAPSNPNTIYASTLRKLFATTNGGTSWSQISTLTITDNFANISNIAVDPTNPDKVFITVSGYSAGNKVWMRPSIGGTWVNYSLNLPNLPVNCIVYKQGSNEELYIGTDVGVYYTNATMPDWIPYQTGLPNVVVTDLEISYYDNKLWAGTFGRGIWKTDLYTPLSISDEEFYNQIIISPNPNNGVFKINVPQGKTYSLIVYDIQGKKIHEELSINTEQKNIDLTKQSSGVYILKIDLEGKLFTKKIIKQ